MEISLGKVVGWGFIVVIGYFMFLKVKENIRIKNEER